MIIEDDMRATTGRSTVSARRDISGLAPVQKFTVVLAVVFVIIGIGGFVPGLTAPYDRLSFASPMSQALLLGLFQVSVLHNVVHLLYGVVGLVAQRTFRASKRYLIVGGAIYAVLFVYGLIVPMGSMANVVPVNLADNLLHAGLAIVMVLAGWLLARRGPVDNDPSGAIEASGNPEPDTLRVHEDPGPR